jgi:hypothetical protein
MFEIIPFCAPIMVAVAALLNCQENLGATPMPDRGAEATNLSTFNPAGGDASAPQGVPVKIWATIYYLIDGVQSVPEGDGIPLRDLGGKPIGPSIRPDDWCDAAMEGSVRVDGIVYNLAGMRGAPEVDCGDPRIERARWVRTSAPYGLGSRSNPLVPFLTVACDLGTVAGSRPWLPGGYPRFGQKIYIPDARGTILPDGSVHDGIFRCADTGSAIIGNHIDVFIGAVVGGEREALRKNPFRFVKSRPDATVDAVLLP